MINEYLASVKFGISCPAMSPVFSFSTATRYCGLIVSLHEFVQPCPPVGHSHNEFINTESVLHGVVGVMISLVCAWLKTQVRSWNSQHTPSPTYTPLSCGFRSFELVKSWLRISYLRRPSWRFSFFPPNLQLSSRYLQIDHDRFFHIQFIVRS
jgi:hypothetical protein